MKLPSTEKSWHNTSMNLKECEMMCTENCSCTAFANLDIRAGGSGCLMWYGDLFDSRTSNGNGQDIYIKLAASKPGMESSLVFILLYNSLLIFCFQILH